MLQYTIYKGYYTATAEQERKKEREKERKKDKHADKLTMLKHAYILSTRRLSPIYMVPEKTICTAAMIDYRAQYVIWITWYCFVNEDCKQQFKHAQNGL